VFNVTDVPGQMSGHAPARRLIPIFDFTVATTGKDATGDMPSADASSVGCSPMSTVRSPVPSDCGARLPRAFDHVLSNVTDFTAKRPAKSYIFKPATDGLSDRKHGAISKNVQSKLEPNVALSTVLG